MAENEKLPLEASVKIGEIIIPRNWKVRKGTFFGDNRKIIFTDHQISEENKAKGLNEGDLMANIMTRNRYGTVRGKLTRINGEKPLTYLGSIAYTTALDLFPKVRIDRQRKDVEMAEENRPFGFDRSVK